MEKLCLQCQSAFTPAKAFGKYCSDVCRRRFNSYKKRSARPIRSCKNPLCHEKFVPLKNHQLYCCVGCQQKAPRQNRPVRKKTSKTIAQKMWSGMNSRIKNKPSYQGIEVRMTKEEFYTWVLPRLEEFLKNHPGKTPSIDRIDSSCHYELSNIRVLGVLRNTTRALLKRVFVDEGKDLSALVFCLVDLCESEKIPVACLISELNSLAVVASGQANV